MKKRSRSPQTKKIARERIAELFAQARAAFPARADLSDRYVLLARKIAMRQRVRIDKEYRRQFCRGCSSFLVPGTTSRARIHEGRVVVTCLICRKRRRYPLGRKSDGEA